MSTEKIMVLADMFADACVSDTEAGYCAASAAELERLEAAIDTARAALATAVSALAAENKVLREDAARYRWLRDNKPVSLLKIVPSQVLCVHPVEAVDAAIDAALTKEATNG